MCVNKWFKRPSKECNTQKKGDFMANSSTKAQRPKISLAEFKRHTAVGEIKRIGKNVVIVDGRGMVKPISQRDIKFLKATVLRDRSSAKIRTNGLSRSQVGRIVGDLREDSSVGVYIRRVPMQHAEEPRATSYEILLMGGDSNEGD